MQVDPPDLGFVATAGRLLRVWREQWRLVLLGLVCALITTGFSLAIPILIRHAIDYSIAPIDGKQEPLWPYLLIVLVLAVFRFGSNFTRRYATARVGIRIEARMRELLYQAYLRFPRAFYDQHATGQVVSRATNDLYPIRYFIGWGMVQGAQSLMMIIGVAVVLVLVNAQLALFALLAMPLVGLLAWLFAREGDARLAPRAAAQGGRDGGCRRVRRRHRDGAGVRPRGRRAHALRRQGACRPRRSPAPGAHRGRLPPGPALPADGVDRDRPVVRRTRRDPRGR